MEPENDGETNMNLLFQGQFSGSMLNFGESNLDVVTLAFSDQWENAKVFGLIPSMCCVSTRTLAKTQREKSHGQKQKKHPVNSPLLFAFQVLRELDIYTPINKHSNDKWTL